MPAGCRRFEYLVSPPRPAGPRHKSEHLRFNDSPAKHPVAPNSPPQAKSAPEHRTGRRTTGSTPRNFRTHGKNKQTEQKTDLERAIREELQGKIVEVNQTDAFIRAFLYMSDASRMEADEKHAAACLSTLQADNASPRSSLADDWEKVPKHKNGQFRQLSELPLEFLSYDVYPNLLNYAGAFFRNAIEGSDAHWPPAQEPGHDDTTPTTSTQSDDTTPTTSTQSPLLRIFRDTHTHSRAYSRDPKDRASLLPDLCLLVESPNPPRKVRAHWKDVLVPIELKRAKLDRPSLTQCARYARAVMQEQFDRKFAFSVLITGDECRVFHWDVVGAHVTKPINIHQDTKTFLQVMGRFATMTPAELGYDTHFSNAGRVLSYQKDLKSHLTIHPAEPPAYFTLSKKPPTPECPLTSAPSMVLELQDMIFEATGLLFNRATRVWRGVAVNDNKPQWTKGKTYIMKQNWADDSRPNEGMFHRLAKEVRAVPGLVCMEECDNTFSYHTQIGDQEVDVLSPDPSHDEDGSGEYDDNASDEDVRMDRASGDGGYFLQRILLRFVFDHGGRSLDEARDAVELLRATIQYIEALCALDAVGIIHRDISEGNLMLPNPDDQDKQASIIDFGLAHWKGPTMELQGETMEGQGETMEGQGRTIEGQGETIEGQQDDTPVGTLEQYLSRGPKWSSQPHCHVTGTLPFVAYDLLASSSEGEAPAHALHHDVESIFWVLVYICLKRGFDVPLTLSGLYERLNSRNIQDVMPAKISLLVAQGKLWPKILGEFGGLTYFIVEFSAHYQSCQLARRPIDVKEVLKLAKQSLELAITNAQRIMGETEKRKAEIREAELKKEAELKAKKGKVPNPSKPTQQKRKTPQLPTIDEYGKPSRKIKKFRDRPNSTAQ